jgi:hypothetical protein
MVNKAKPDLVDIVTPPVAALPMGLVWLIR